MTRPISRPRRNARRFFLGLTLLALGGGLLWLAPWFKNRLGKGQRDRPPELIEVDSGERPLMGTTARIVVHVAEVEKGQAAIEAAFQRAEEINAICSDYNPESEIMRLCREPIN
ncbi:MAG: hypothetical protein VX317_02920, partial [Verrucomicrobiota bacterium]|nr:hypothetical protein [Verrucomicrobiota bacterium]